MHNPGELDETHAALANYTFAEIDYNDSGVHDLNFTQLFEELLSPKKNATKKIERRSTPLENVFKVPQSMSQKREYPAIQGMGLWKSKWKSEDETHPLPSKIPKMKGQSVFETPHVASTSRSQLAFENTSQLSFLGGSRLSDNEGQLIQNDSGSNESWNDDILDEIRYSELLRSPSQSFLYEEDESPNRSIQKEQLTSKLTEGSQDALNGFEVPNVSSSNQLSVPNRSRLDPVKPNISKSSESWFDDEINFLEDDVTDQIRDCSSSQSQSYRYEVNCSQNRSVTPRRSHPLRTTSRDLLNTFEIRPRKQPINTDTYTISQKSCKSVGMSQKNQKETQRSQPQKSQMTQPQISNPVTAPAFRFVPKKSTIKPPPKKNESNQLTNQVSQERSAPQPDRSICSYAIPKPIESVQENVVKQKDKVEIFPGTFLYHESNLRKSNNDFTQISQVSQNQVEDLSKTSQAFSKTPKSVQRTQRFSLSQDDSTRVPEGFSRSQSSSKQVSLSQEGPSSNRFRTEKNSIVEMIPKNSQRCSLSQGSQTKNRPFRIVFVPVHSSQDKPQENELSQVSREKSTSCQDLSIKSQPLTKTKNSEEMDWDESLNESINDTTRGSTSLQKYFESVGEEYDMLAFKSQVERTNETNTSVVSMDVEEPRPTAASPELFTSDDDEPVIMENPNSIIVNTYYEYKDDEEKFMKIESKIKNLNWKTEMEKLIENPEDEMNFEATYDYLKWKYMKTKGKTRSIGKINDEIDLSEFDPKDVECLSQLSRVAGSQSPDDYMPWNEGTESDEEREILSAFEEERQSVQHAKTIQWTPLSLDVYQPGKNDQLLMKPVKPFHWTTPPASPLSPPFRGLSQETPLSMVDDSQQTQLQLKPVKVKARKNAKKSEPRVDEHARKIEALIVQMLEDLVAGKHPKIQIVKNRKRDNIDEDNDILSLKDDDTVVRNVTYSETSMNMFDTVINLLSSIHTLLMTNSTCTKRELYYRNLELFPNQIAVNQALDHISCLLDAPLWELGVMSTSKGLVAGNLTVVYESNTICYTKGKTDIVPNNLSGIKDLKSEAEFVLIVEKDTVFKRLLDNRIFETLNLILITGKGFPDVNTRFLIKKIVHILKIPAYIIVDADPHGIEIMLTYKFGSLNLAHIADELACPAIKWIGLKPGDAEDLKTVAQDLTLDDVKKVNELLQRRYITATITQQLEVFKRTKRKAEIESLYEFSPTYLVREFIPTMIKISSVDDDDD